MLASHKCDDSLVQLDPQDTKTLAIYNNSVNASTVSSRYNHITTYDLVETAKAVGFEPFNYGVLKRKFTSIKKGLSADTVRHFVALRPNDDILNKFGLLNKLDLNKDARMVSRAWPCTLLYNAHDGSSAAIARTGLYEFVCSNTAIISSTTFDEVRFVHLKVNFQKIKEAFIKLLEYSPTLLQIRDQLSRILLSKDQALELSSRCIPIRWSVKDYEVQPYKLLWSRYEEQDERNAYNVFQNIQRNLTKENFRVHNLVSERDRTTRKIKSFQELRRINESLWNTTETYLSELGHPVGDII